MGELIGARGIADGVVEATVVQQPYEFGYKSMMNMAKVLEGDTSFIPENELMIVPTKVIDKSNVAEFQKEMQQLLSQ